MVNSLPFVLSAFKMIARPAALVAEFEGGHSDASKHILCVNLPPRALVCAAQWSWYIGAAGTGEGQLCLAAPPKRTRKSDG
ncbi:unnamed protein product, partial [Aureobasidium mustum]